MPSGWPSAMAPPWGFTCSASSGKPSWRKQASACDERLVDLDKVEVTDLEAETLHQLAGRRHRSDAHHPRWHPADAMPSTRARGVRPWRFTASAEATIMAAAPSLTPDALPAVTVPGVRNAAGVLAHATTAKHGRAVNVHEAKRLADNPELPRSEPRNHFRHHLVLR